MAIAIYKKVPASGRGSSGKLKLVSVVFMVLGALMVGLVTGPIIAYLALVGPGLRRPARLISPLPPAPNIFLPQASAGETFYGEVDYKRLENWFVPVPLPGLRSNGITHYNLTISELGIYDAVVAVGGEDLSKSLIQYPGTANPGEPGSTVIFGHSILRQFYNPKNYLSIFSTIMTLQNGDEMGINYNGVEYTYKVIDKFEVKPTDVDILQQRYDGRYLKLITCVPEGTYLRRGVVLAKLVN